MPSLIEQNTKLFSFYLAKPLKHTGTQKTVRNRRSGTDFEISFLVRFPCRDTLQ